jgi:hypothetical protein
MPQPPSAYDLHQRERWTRHDAHLWLRHDYARWLKPGTDPEEVYPHLKRQREAAEDAAFAAKIAASRRFLAALRAEVDELKAALARRRLEEAKYSPDQPRVPKRNPGGGQFTRIGEGIGQSPSANIAQPMGDVDFGDVTGSSDASDLFQIKPDDASTNDEQVADVIRVCTVIGAGRGTVDGVKTYSVTYECFGGRTFRVEGFGHNFPGIVLDRFR